MRGTKSFVKSLSDDLAVFDDDAADHRVGFNLPAPAHGQQDRVV